MPSALLGMPSSRTVRRRSERPVEVDAPRWRKRSRLAIMRVDRVLDSSNRGCLRWLSELQYLCATKSSKWKVR